MSIYIEETILGNSALMPFNSPIRDSALATCRTLILINSLIVADPDNIGGAIHNRSSEAGTMRISLSPLNQGVTQITSLLNQCPNIQALHIYTTGAPGRLDLGRDVLTNETIERYAWDIQSWFSRLPTYAKPSLVLGHCNVGDGIKGVTFIDQLRYLTGCQIRCLCSSNGHHLQLV